MAKYYFASDFHLGVPNSEASMARELKVIRWLKSIQHEAEAIFLVGDIFDFWFEYKSAVPKHFTRLLGTLAELTDQGIKIYFFKGNHDLWTFGYLEQECGLTLVNEELNINLNGLNVFIHHGDGLGPGDRFFKFWRRLFRSKFAQFAFGWIHPDIGIPLANYFSGSSRKKNKLAKTEIALEQEFQYQFALQYLKHDAIDLFVFGHRHNPRDIALNSSRFVNLGDWISHFTYLELDGTKTNLKHFD